MDISVSAKAKDYILARGGTAHLVSHQGMSLCWGRIRFSPSVGLGKPKNADDYNLQVIDGVNVYLPRGFETVFPLTIELNNIFGFKYLYIEGWKLI